ISPGGDGGSRGRAGVARTPAMIVVVRGLAFLLLVGVAIGLGAAVPAPSPGPVATPPSPAASAPPPDSCVSCHLDTGDARLAGPVRQFASDIHNAKGLGCVACHGGDAHAPGMEAMDPAKGFLGKPTRQQIPALCGRCHANATFMKQHNPSLRVDQVAEYAI